MPANDLNVMPGTSLEEQISEIIPEFDEEASDGLISFQAELPAALQAAMVEFIERYPNWDQYRLVQAALAGFLVQKGVESRQITRLYVGNMFCSNALTESF
ncbi:DUF2811 domain-containing protein [Prochlorococcus sp. MIT 1300]|uniref:DUF2811 domain-containing protein n=1 Tax=Prochlorococcus sp. MIT 1300 TaxID=3096218 RepID=UPI002A74A2D0|nr:DUF2811 domain-containing protein [Prochlorococcus sp. MIT 1300]